MSKAPKTTLEQWFALREVVEAGGFVQAAERMHRSQSSVSYAVQRLQERLGVALLEVRGRRARLTETGRQMLADVSPLIDVMRNLEGRTRAPETRPQKRMRLLADNLFPRRRLFDAFENFRCLYPEIEIVLQESARQTVPDAAADPFDLAIAAWTPHQPASHHLHEVEMLAVASPRHPLCAIHQPLSQAMLARHMAVVIDSPDRTEVLSGGPAAQCRQWRVNQLGSAVEAVLSGMCYGYLPRHRIDGHLERAELKQLNLRAAATRWVPLMLVYADEANASSATVDMASLLMKPSGVAEMRLSA